MLVDRLKHVEVMNRSTMIILNGGLNMQCSRLSPTCLYTQIERTKHDEAVKRARLIFGFIQEPSMGCKINVVCVLDLENNGSPVSVD